MNDRKKALQADLMLLLIAIFFGFAYTFMKIALTEVGTFTLNTYRFVGAFAVAMIFTFPKMRGISKESIRGGFIVGIALAIMYFGATLGVQYTTTSNCAFLIATTVFFTPLFDFLLFKRTPPRKILIALVICVIGIALMTLKEDFSLNMANLKGDLYSLLCGVFYALEIVLTGRVVRNDKVDPYQMGVVSLGACGLIMLVLSLVLEFPIALPQTPVVWIVVILLSVFCTGAAFILQPVAQQYTTPAHVGIIFSLEPVFAAIIAFIISGEVLTFRGIIGATLMVISFLYMEIDFSGSKSAQKEAE